LHTKVDKRHATNNKGFEHRHYFRQIMGFINHTERTAKN